MPRITRETIEWEPEPTYTVTPVLEEVTVLRPSLVVTRNQLSGYGGPRLTREVLQDHDDNFRPRPRRIESARETPRRIASSAYRPEREQGSDARLYLGRGKLPSGYRDPETDPFFTAGDSSDDDETSTMRSGSNSRFDTPSSPQRSRAPSYSASTASPAARERARPLPDRSQRRLPTTAPPSQAELSKDYATAYRSLPPAASSYRSPAASSPAQSPYPSQQSSYRFPQPRSSSPPSSSSYRALPSSSSSPSAAQRSPSPEPLLALPAPGTSAGDYCDDDDALRALGILKTPRKSDSGVSRGAGSGSASGSGALVRHEDCADDDALRAMGILRIEDRPGSGIGGAGNGALVKGGYWD